MALSTSRRNEGAWRGQPRTLPLPGPTPQPAAFGDGVAVGSGVGTGTGTSGGTAGIATGLTMTGTTAGALACGAGWFSVIVWQPERTSAEARKEAGLFKIMSGGCH